MFIKLCQYLGHRLTKKGELRLAMTILVKDEADIIADNIRVHSSLGVDCFAVMDNGSTDGTRDILNSLSKEFDLHVIDQKEQTYRQRFWMTELAIYAGKSLKADCVISNDADEFWLPRSGGLKDHLEGDVSIITCRRFNMLLSEESSSPEYHYYDSSLRVQYPIFYDIASQKTDDAVIIPLAKISPKVITNPHGLLRIEGGNHRAKHVASPWSKSDSTQIFVYHYPIRSYSQFERNIKNRLFLVKNNKSIRQGPHYQRWLRMLEQGKLEEEYERFIIKEGDVPTLKRFSVVCEDMFPRESIKRALGNHA